MNLSFQWSSTPDNVKKVLVQKISILEKLVSPEAQVDIICKYFSKIEHHTVTITLNDGKLSLVSKKSHHILITAFDDSLHTIRREIVHHKSKSVDNQRHFARNIKNILTHN